MTQTIFDEIASGKAIMSRHGVGVNATLRRMGRGDRLYLCGKTTKRLPVTGTVLQELMVDGKRFRARAVTGGLSITRVL